jgi:hypothetical protein
MLVRAMITAPAAIRIRALIPDPAAIRTGRAMSMPRLESRAPPATGLPRASGTVMPGASAACASAADQVAAAMYAIAYVRSSYPLIRRAFTLASRASVIGPLFAIERGVLAHEAR